MTHPLLTPETPTHPKLGRLAAEDPRDENYPARAILTQPGQTYRYWNETRWWGNQGNQPHCVEYAWHHMVADGPITKRAPVWTPGSLYPEFQRNDEWPGEDYDGTSVRAGAKILQAMGIIAVYHWCRTVGEVELAVKTKGPVVMGTIWTEGMWDTNEYGLLHPREGGIVGGHAYVINGVNSKEKVRGRNETGLFRCKNSWGRAWGDEGRFWISFADLEYLLADDGEACIATEALDQR